MGQFAAFGMKAEAATLAPGLHVVATPIGNLGDVSFRALSTLAAADAVLAEDTRHTKTLLAHYGVSTPLEAYHEHNAERVRPRLIERLQAGAKLALVSDAGTPLVSDPGYKLVADAVAAGVAITGVPGPSAILAALVLAGLPTDRFFFEGFLPTRTAARRARLHKLAGVPGTLVLFESPRRIAAALHDAATVLGPRQAAVARELTKAYEEVRRGDLTALSAHYAAAGAPRGEIVLLIGPPDGEHAPPDDEILDRALRQRLGEMSLKEAVAGVSADTGLPRKTVYARALELSRRP